MQQVWLNQTGAKDCILFLSGWGMDENPFVPVLSGEHDILMVYDYRELHPLDPGELGRYDRIHLVAWSMGVWVAGHLLQDMFLHFTTRLAFGGTLDPVHQTLGIPPEAYLELENNFSAQRLTDFQESMFTDQGELELFAANRPKRPLREVHEELCAFRQHYEAFGKASDVFTHKIVTSRDRVYPLKNQRRAWGKNDAVTLKLPHFPFYSLQNWSAILHTGQ